MRLGAYVRGSTANPYGRKHLGASGLGDAYDPVPIDGTPFVLAFTVSGTPLQPRDIEAALKRWQPFASGNLRILNIALPPGSLALTLASTDTRMSAVTMGGLAGAISSTLGDAFGLHDFVPTSAPGLGPTSFSAQFEQQGGFTWSPFAWVNPQTPGPLSLPGSSASSGGLPSLPRLPSFSDWVKANWPWLALGAGGLVFAAKAL